uniref:Bestrophin homolog n=1 Tax=Gongylonema pulchrum TaxID=637853 RepID=A0A183D192_9BILA
MFERTAMYFGNYLNDNNLMFILGFFLTCVATRWDVLLRNIGFIESLALFVSACVRGEDDESRMYRRTIVRHACLAQCLVLRDISVRVRRRFPTMESLIDAGFLTKKELDKFNSYKTSYDKFWVPISWSLTNVMNARRTEKQLKEFKACLQTLTNYDWVPLPLVYPQMLTISVYLYFAVCLFARQHFLSGVNSENVFCIIYYIYFCFSSYP